MSTSCNLLSVRHLSWKERLERPRGLRDLSLSEILELLVADLAECLSPVLASLCNSLALFRERDPNGEKRQGILHDSRLFVLSIAKPFLESPVRFNFHRHQRFLPRRVDHLQVVAAPLKVQLVVHASGSPLYQVNVEDSVDHEGGLSSSQHWEPFLCLHLFGHLTLSLKL